MYTCNVLFIHACKIPTMKFVYSGRREIIIAVIALIIVVGSACGIMYGCGIFGMRNSTSATNATNEGSENCGVATEDKANHLK